MNIVVTLLLFLFIVLFVILGVQFQRGKWLGLLSGNVFGDLSMEKANSAGKEASHLMYFSAAFCLFFWWWMTFSKNQQLFWCGIVLALLVSGYTLTRALKEWIRTGY